MRNALPPHDEPTVCRECGEPHARGLDYHAECETGAAMRELVAQLGYERVRGMIESGALVRMARSACAAAAEIEAEDDGGDWTSREADGSPRIEF